MLDVLTRATWQRRMLAAAPLLSVCGCATTRPVPLHMSLRADSATYARFSGKGSGSIQGQAFLTTRGGDVKLGAGRVVTLDPATLYAMEWYRQIGADQARFDEAPPDSAFRKARRTTTIDAQGHFRFRNLPSGTYLLRSIVSWETIAPNAGSQGGVVADTVTIDGSEEKEVILNHVVTQLAPITVAILTRDEVGNRTFGVLAKISGTSCKRGTGDPDPTEAFARTDLADTAAKLRADALTNVICERGGMSLRKNCYSYIECKGDAIHWL